LILVLILGYLLVLGCNEHETNLEKAKKFKDLEKTLYSRLISYTHVSIQGIRLLLIPSQMEIFFINSNVFSDISSRINTTASLQISSNLKDRNLFKKNHVIGWDFAGMLILAFSILWLLFGTETFSSKEYLKLHASVAPHKLAFLYTIASRLILLALTILSLFGILFILLRINHIVFSASDFNCFTGYISYVILISVFFFSSGVLIGYIKSKAARTITVFLVLFLFLFVIPGLLGFYTEQKAESVSSDYQNEFDKINILTDFEKKAIEVNKEFDIKNIEGARKVMENLFWNQYYPKVNDVDDRVKEKIVENIDRYRKLSVLFPTTFYFASCNEISSRGYDSFIDFYSYLQEMKSKFVRFWIDRVYYNDPKAIVNFIEGDENTFHAKSRLPGNFPIGILITLGYIFLLLTVSYFQFKKSLFKMKKSELAYCADKVDVKFKKGDFKVWNINGRNFVDLLYNLFSGQNKTIKKKAPEIKVLVDNVDIAAEKNRRDFLYLCHSDKIPGDIKVKDLIRLFAGIRKFPKDKIKEIMSMPEIKDFTGKKFDNLSDSRKAEVLLSLTFIGKSEIYLFNEIVSIMSVDFADRFRKRMETLSNEGSLVLYLTSNETNVYDKKVDEPYFHETDKWTGIIDAFNSIKKKHF
jgi:ABC-type transport system involved in cytochrome c biogenesis ATPase subunit